MIVRYSCLPAREVTISLRHKRPGKVATLERVVIPVRWRRSDLLRYARGVHGPEVAVRIDTWPDRVYDLWLANPRAFSDFAGAVFV